MKVKFYWGHTFLPGLIHPEGVVFDFGVHSGGFSILVSPLCRCVIGFEPDPRWLDCLSLPENVQVIPKALAATTGKKGIYMNIQKCSSLHYSDPHSRRVEVEAMSLADALALEPVGRIELIKMDIEGEELAVLQNASQLLLERVAQMTVEFHDFLDPSSLPAIRSVICKLKNSGFLAVKFSWRSYGDCLFVNRRLEPMTFWQRLLLIAVHKYGRGLVRVVRRL